MTIENTRKKGRSAVTALLFDEGRRGFEKKRHPPFKPARQQRHSKKPLKAVSK